MPAIEVGRWGINPWECDEMLHLNVRFYARFGHEGLVGFAPHLALPNTFRAGATSTLLVREHHIRFLKEARSRDTLHMTAEVLDIGETDARILFQLYHSKDGKPAAAITSRVEHVTTADGRPFPWPKATLKAAEAFRGTAADHTKLRSLSAEPVGAMQASMERAEALGLQRLAAGALVARDVDLFGRMEAEMVIGRVSDNIVRLVVPFRQTVIDHAEVKPANVGGAALEYRVLYLDWPRAGDRYDVRSGVSGVNGYGQKMIHWFLDPGTGRPWAVSEVYVITFDLDARKIVPVSQKAQEVILQGAVKGLRF